MDKFDNHLKVFANQKANKYLAKIFQKDLMGADPLALLDLLYDNQALKSGKFDLDDILAISDYKTSSSDCTLNLVTQNTPSYNLQDHITSLAFQADSDAIAVNYVYHNGSLKLIRLTCCIAYDGENSNDEYFFNELLETKAFSGTGDEYEVLLEKMDGEKSNTNSKKMKTPWDYKYFALLSFACHIGPQGKQISRSLNKFMWLKRNVYQPIEFLDLEEGEIKSMTDFPFESNYDYGLDLQSTSCLAESDFFDVLRPALVAYPLLRVVFTKRKYEFFKDFCMSEESAFFVVDCRKLPYTDPEFILFETSKDKFLSYLQGAVGVEQGNNFVVQGDIALNWWFFNYFKEGQLRVDYFTDEGVRKLYRGPLINAVGSLLE